MEGELVNASVLPFACVLLAHPQALLLFPFRFGWVVLVHYLVACRDAQTHLLCGLVSCREEPVVVVESGGAGSYHFYAGDLGCPIDIVVVEIFLGLPYMADPFGEKHILTDAAHQRHCSVGMHIDESRSCYLAAAVHYFDITREFPSGHRAGIFNPAYDSVLDEYVAFPAVETYVPEYNGSHQNRSDSSPCSSVSCSRTGISPPKQFTLM